MDIIYNMDILIYICICPGFDSKGGNLVNLLSSTRIPEKIDPRGLQPSIIGCHQHIERHHLSLNSCLRSPPYFKVRNK